MLHWGLAPVQHPCSPCQASVHPHAYLTHSQCILLNLEYKYLTVSIIMRNIIIQHQCSQVWIHYPCQDTHSKPKLSFTYSLTVYMLDLKWVFLVFSLWLGGWLFNLSIVTNCYQCSWYCHVIAVTTVGEIVNTLQGDEWEEKWGEWWASLGRANKWADKWAKDGNNVWHEKWGEEYDGEGGCVKFTDKVTQAVTSTGNASRSLKGYQPLTSRRCQCTRFHMSHQGSKFRLK